MLVSEKSVSSEDLALEILEVIPIIMHEARLEMRKNRVMGLSVPQFRALAILRRSPGISLAELAEQVGLLPSSASAMVDGLANKGLVMRTESSEDRRRIALRLTEAGTEVLDMSERAARSSMAERLSALEGKSREQIYAALQLLRPLYGLESERPAGAKKSG